MSRQLTWSLVADGTTDRMLVPIIEWALRRQDPIVELLEPQFRKRHGSIRDDLPDSDTGSMLVFMHRDAEDSSLDERLREFSGIDRMDLVPVVPVRMSEAWLLFDACAIAKAAGSMAAALPTPGVGDLEGIADPKALLQDLLLDAAGNADGPARQGVQTVPCGATRERGPVHL